MWWALLTALELMLISAVDRYELAVALVLGLAAAVGTVGLRAAQPSAWRVPAGAARWLLLVPLEVVTGTVRVLAAAATGSRGTLDRLQLQGATGDDSAACGVRAAVGQILNATPGSVVVDIDRDTGTLLVHHLGGRGSALERAMTSS